MFTRLGAFTVRRRKGVLVGSVLAVVLAGFLGSGVFAELSGGGFDNPSSDSTRYTFMLLRNVRWAPPGRSVSSYRTGTSTEPRREDTRTLSPFSTPYVAPSSGETSSVSPRRSGEVYPRVWTPVLKESRRRPVVSRMG